MNSLLKNRHWTDVLRVVITLFIVLSLVLAFFHFHEDGEHSDCQVCRLVQFISGVLVLGAATIFISTPKGQKFQPVLETRLSSLFLPSSLKDRAPPAFSF